jgi:autotransporter-associated beta strand protein
VIENANSYTGRTDLAAGTLTLGNDAALGAGTLAIEGGTLQPSGGVREVANAIDVGPLYQQEDPLEVTLAGSHQLRLTGPVRLRREAQVYVLNVTNSNKVIVEDQVTEQTGDTMVVKRGPGTLEVSGTTSHTGGTWTQEGELRLDAGIIRGRVTLADFEWLSGPKLTGFGTIGGDLGVIASGHVDPGLDNDTPGYFVVDGKLAMFDSRYSVDLHGPSRASDSIIVDGPSVSLGGALDVRLHLDPQVGDSFKIIDHRGNGATEGAFAGWPEGTSFTVRGPRGLFVTMTITYKGGDGNDVVLTALTREKLSAALPRPMTRFRRRRLIPLAWVRLPGRPG